MVHENFFHSNFSGKFYLGMVNFLVEKIRQNDEIKLILGEFVKLSSVGRNFVVSGSNSIYLLV